MSKFKNITISKLGDRLTVNKLVDLWRGTEANRKKHLQNIDIDITCKVVILLYLDILLY